MSTTANITGLHYFQTEGEAGHEIAVYHMYLKGDLIFKVYAFQAQAYVMGENYVVPLSVATPDEAKVITTAGRGLLVQEGNAARVSGGSVQAYIIPRVTLILARLYVPGFHG